MSASGILSRRAAATALAMILIAAAGCSRGPREVRSVRVGPVTVDALTAERAAVPGRLLTLGWRFRLEPGWHLYWHGTNDTGAPPSVTLDLPAGWEPGPLRWPAPTRLVAPGDILDHVYADSVVLLQTVRVADDAPMGGTAAFRAHLDWLACRDACVPGSADLSLVLPVARHTSPSHGGDVLTRVFRELPRPLPDGVAACDWSGATLRVSVAGASRLEFDPLESCGPLSAPIPDAAADADSLRLRFRARDAVVGPARGLLQVWSGEGPPRVYEMNVPAAPAADPEPGGTR